jgi:tetratricopeptide (TPR) repeat protein
VVVVCLALCVVSVEAGRGQAAKPAEDRGNQALLSGVGLLAAGDIDGALHIFNNLAGTTTIPALAQRAQCYGGAALTISDDIRTAEQLVEVMNRSAAANPKAGWAQTLPECVKQLEGIAPGMAPAKRASLFYFLGLVGTDENAHIRFLRESVKLQPDFGQAAYQLAAHLLAFGEMDEAAMLFRRVAEQHPEWAEPRANLGVVFNLTGRPTDAVRELREAIKIRPDYAEAHGQLGMALYGAGQNDEAVSECARALRDEPQNPLYYNCTALVLLEKERPGDAVAYARRATELAPAHETFLVVLAAAQLGDGREPEALASIRRAIALQPRLRSDPTRLEKADLLRGKALALARQLVEKAK